MNQSKVLLGAFLLIVFSFPVITGCGAPGKPKQEETLKPVSEKWQVIGPGGGGGQFLPTINPRDPKHVFVRCDMTGAYVTLDGGESWRMFNLRTVVSDFEFDPGNPNTIYAANNALYRSDDRGARWHLVYPDPRNVVAERMIGDHAGQRFETKDGMPDGPIDKVRVDPTNSDRIYLGMGGSRFSSPDRRMGTGGDSARVVFSTDRGKSWSVAARVYGRRILAIFPGAWDDRPDELTVITDRAASRVALETGETEALVLPVERVIDSDGGTGPEGSVFYILADMELIEGKVAGGVYCSNDQGETWTQVNEGLLGGLPSTGKLPRFGTLAVCEGDTRVLYLGCRSYTARTGDGTEMRSFGIFKTETGAESWRWVYQATGDSVIGDNFRGGWMNRSYGPAWGGSPISLGICPTNPDICYATDYGRTYRTLDGGAIWEQVYGKTLPDSSVTSRGLDVTTCYGVHFDPFDKNHIFISYTDIGAFHSYNGGKSWIHSISGVTRSWINTCYWLVFDPEIKGRIWSVWGNCHDLPRPKMFRSGRLEQGGFQGGVAVSEDGGRNWRPTTEGMPPSAVCTHILLDPESPADSRTLYVCGFAEGVFKSTDGGRNWKNASSGLGPKPYAWRMTRLPEGTLFLLVARGGVEGREYIDGALYRSDDKAESWRKIELPRDVNAPNDLVFDPSHPKRMYLSCWPWPKEGREHAGGLLRTEDGGTSWEQVFDEEAHVYAAAVDPENPSTVYVNTFDSAAFRSYDRGESWHRLEGYNFKWGHRPVVDPHNPGMLYLTTFGGSVFHGPAKGVPGAFEDIVESDILRWQ
ncbi:MAG TPA: hypothetical protein VM123_14380 [archaeon]|nr:hypothetical protein [archaeon]